MGKRFVVATDPEGLGAAVPGDGAAGQSRPGTRGQRWSALLCQCGLPRGRAGMKRPIPMEIDPNSGEETFRSVVRRGDEDGARVRLARDPAAAGRVDEEGNTPLHWGAGRSPRRAVRHRGRAPSTWSPAHPPATALTAAHRTAAALWGQVGVVQLLIGHGAATGAANRCGHRPLHWAAQRHLAAVHALISAGADPSAPDDKGCTPVLHASQRGATLAMDYLARRGASLDVQDSRGRTPLHW